MKEKNCVNRLLNIMHCANCKSEYDEDSAKIMRSENGLLVAQIRCKHCNKCFGMAFFGIGAKELEQALETEADSAKGGSLPISFDDVLDAHKFFQNLDDNWAKFIKNK